MGASCCAQNSMLDPSPRSSLWTSSSLPHELELPKEAAVFAMRKDALIDCLAAKLRVRSMTFEGVPRRLNSRLFCRPSLYSEDASGRVVYLDPLIEESAVTDEELAWVVVPTLTALATQVDRSFLEMVLTTCSDDLLLRVVRGYVNSKPSGKEWQAMVISGDNATRHVAATSESLSRIMRWRTQHKVDEHELFRRPLKNSKLFHNLWPFFFTGYDDNGHPVFLERIGDLRAKELQDHFSLEEIILHRAQVHELVQHFTAISPSFCHHDGSNTRLKHVHVIDLAHIHFRELRSLRTSVEAVFKIADEVYPSPSSLFLLNTPAVFRILAWPVIKLWLDAQTVSRVIVLGAVPILPPPSSVSSSELTAASECADNVDIVGNENLTVTAAAAARSSSGRRVSLPSAFLKQGIRAEVLPLWAGGFVVEGVSAFDLLQAAREQVVSAAASAVSDVDMGELRFKEGSSFIEESQYHGNTAAGCQTGHNNGGSDDVDGSIGSGGGGGGEDTLRTMATAVARNRADTLKPGLSEALLKRLVKVLQDEIHYKEQHTVAPRQNNEIDQGALELSAVVARDEESSKPEQKAPNSTSDRIMRRQSLSIKRKSGGWRSFLFVGFLAALVLYVGVGVP